MRAYRLLALDLARTAAPSADQVPAQVPQTHSTPHSLAAARSKHGGASLAVNYVIEPNPTNGMDSIGVYSGLQHSSLMLGSLSTQLQLPTAQQTPSKFESHLEQLLQRNMTSHAARTQVATKLQDRSILLDNPTPSLAASAVARLPSSTQYASHLLGRRKRHQPLDTASAQLTYAAVEPLHHLWQQYITTVTCGQQHEEARLLQADYHGCMMSVSCSKNPQHVGKQGIIVKVTANTFHLFDCNDRLHIVPKQGSRFDFRLQDGRLVTLQGSNLAAALSGKTQPAASMKL